MRGSAHDTCPSKQHHVHKLQYHPGSRAQHLLNPRQHLFPVEPTANAQHHVPSICLTLVSTFFLWSLLLMHKSPAKSSSVSDTRRFPSTLPSTNCLRYCPSCKTWSNQSATSSTLHPRTLSESTLLLPWFGMWTFSFGVWAREIWAFGLGPRNEGHSTV